jgi:cyclopropane fatty-acyl-phospholipid synthase-like methyltransferase
MIYERGNAAKQWILAELHEQLGAAPLRVLDLACGDASKWRVFLEQHSNVSVLGLNTDQSAIQKGNKLFAGESRIVLRTLDAQKTMQEQPFDVVVAMSAIEHIVDRTAFLKTAWDALKSGGTAYLNYDVGHFRSRSIKERVMVPVSQLLAMIGVEGPYMKRVDDALFRRQAEAQGFRFLGLRKHNLHPLKGFMRGANDVAIMEWCAFEDRLNEQFTPEALDGIMWSSTLIVQKP